jgi:hypothetical protein
VRSLETPRAALLAAGRDADADAETETLSGSLVV